MIKYTKLFTPNTFAKDASYVFKRRNHEYLRFSRMFPPANVGEEAPVTGALRHLVSQKMFTSASPGTFYLLPLLTRALSKLHRLIDEHMQMVGAQKITMPCLAPAHIWKKSERWEEMGSELLTLEDRRGAAHCLAPTHEEAVTSLVATECPISYKRLPVKLYQIGRKFRDERRPKHGLLRCREFEMKDLYTFSSDEEGALHCFEEVCASYTALLNRLHVPHLKVEASSGAMGGSKSQEYHILSPIGEDTLYQCSMCGIGFNKELLDDNRHTCLREDCKWGYVETAGIEVAHAFVLGTKYSSVFDATYIDKEKRVLPLYMGCYGIGVTRLLAAVTEVLSTDTHLTWPHLLAPHQICIIPQKKGYKSEVTDELAESLHRKLSSLASLKNEVVLDDRTQLSIGSRVKTAQHMGFPHIITVGRKALEDVPRYESMDVQHGNTEFLTAEQLLTKYDAIETISV